MDMTAEKVESLPNGQVKNGRDVGIDIAKGIAILLVIVGHLEIPYVDAFIFSFHMPIFFIISGMFFRDRDGIIKTKFLKYAKPYAFTIVAIIIERIIVNLVTYFVNGSPESIFHVITHDIVLRWLEAGIVGSTCGDILGMEIPTVGMLWFFWALFWVEAIHHFVVKVKSPLLQIAIAFFLLIFSLKTIKVTGLPFSLQAAGSCYIFFYVGYRLKSELKVNHLVVVLLCGLVWLVDLYYAMKGDTPNFGFSYYPDEILNLAGAVAASYLVLALSRRLSLLKIPTSIFTYFGRYSGVVLCFHFIEQVFIDWPNTIATLSDRYNYVLLVIAAIVIKFIIAFLAIQLVLHSRFLKKIFL